MEQQVNGQLIEPLQIFPRGNVEQILINNDYFSKLFHQQLCLFSKGLNAHNMIFSS